MNDESSTDAGAICGNGIVERGEVCDDGVNDGGYGGCFFGCGAYGPYCGDGIEQGDESCDDGDQTNGNGCNIDCVFSGSVRWTETIDSVIEIRGLAIAAEDEVIAVGSEGTQAWIRRYASDGSTVWTTTSAVPGGDNTHAWDVATDGDGNIYAVGYYNGVGTSSDNGWVRKYDGDGSAVYLHTFDSVADASSDHINGVAVSDDGYAVVVGQADPDTRDIWVRGLEQDGSESWTRTYDAGGSDYAAAVAIDLAGAFTVVGSAFDGSFNAWIRKFEPNGATLWTEIEEGMPYAYPYDVATDSVDRIVLAGYLDGDAWVQQRDALGTTLWTDTFSTNSGTVAFLSIATDSDDNVTVVGYRNDTREMLVRKYTVDGEELWTHQGHIDMPMEYGDTIASSVTVDSEQNVIVGGREQLDDLSYAWIRKFAP